MVRFFREGVFLGVGVFFFFWSKVGFWVFDLFFWMDVFFFCRFVWFRFFFFFDIIYKNIFWVVKIFLYRII